MRFVNLIFLVILISCTSEKKTSKNSSISEEKSSICAVIDNWHKNAAEANFESYFEAMSIDGIFIGTDASENWTISEFKSFSKPFFDRGEAWSFTSIERNVYLNNDAELAWFDELLDTWMGVCRGSGVLKKVDATWKIEHYVLSLTTPNENVNDIVKINKKRDSIFLNKFKY